MVNEDELMIIMSKLNEDDYDVLSLVLHKDMLAIIQELAQRQNIGSETLVERWLEEKIKDQPLTTVTNGETNGK